MIPACDPRLRSDAMILAAGVDYYEMQKVDMGRTRVIR
jgi:hypothetical protein